MNRDSIHPVLRPHGRLSLAAALGPSLAACPIEINGQTDAYAPGYDAYLARDSGSRDGAQPHDAGPVDSDQPLDTNGTDRRVLITDAAMADRARPDTAAGNDSGSNCIRSNFSFFVMSLEKIQEWGGQEGLGGNLGGLASADARCQQAAESVGSCKTWRAFLSVADDGTGNPVNAIDRIGTGPWYDVNGHLFAENIAARCTSRGARPRAGSAPARSAHPSWRPTSRPVRAPTNQPAPTS